MAAGFSQALPYGPGAIGAPTGGGVQIIGGQRYQMYSPEWYAAQRQYATDRAGAAGTAAGTYAKNYLNTAMPGAQGAFSGALSGLQGALGGSAVAGTPAVTGGIGGATPGLQTGGGPVGGGGYVAPIQMADTSAANAAAYAKAKDQVGQSSRSAIDSLRDVLGATGQLGGGAEAQATRDIVSSAAGDLGQVSRDQAQTGAELAQRTAEMGYQGALTQRGQDIAAQEANARLALEARQQYLSLLQTALGGAMGGLKGALGGGTGAGGDLLY